MSSATESATESSVTWSDYQTETSFNRYEEKLHPLLPYNTVTTVPVIVLNWFIIQHYSKEYKKFVPSVYLLIASCDFLMTLSLLSQSILLELSYHRPFDTLHTNSIFIILCTVVSAISYRCSVFANLLLAVARTIQIISPFYSIRRRIAYLSVALYLLLLVCFAAYDATALIYFGSLSSSDPDFEDIVELADIYSSQPVIGTEFANMMAEVFAAEGSDYNEVVGNYIPIIFLFVSFTVPVTAVLVCMIIQLHWLRKPTPSDESAQTQKHVTVTIMQLTGIFFLCNIPYTVMQSFYTVMHIRLIAMRDESFRFFSSFWTIRAITHTTLPLINAVLNPAILISRSATLKASMVKIVRYCLRMVPDTTVRRRTVRRKPVRRRTVIPPAANSAVAEAEESGVAANAIAVTQL